MDDVQWIFGDRQVFNEIARKGVKPQPFPEKVPVPP